MSSERIALFADLHSNLEALEACIAHAQEMGADRYVFLGDLVGYNADPVAVIDRIAEFVQSGKGVALQGNHDAACFEDYSKKLNPSALAAIDWTRSQLQSHHIDFLKNLPLVIQEEDNCFVHASAHNPADWNYVNDGMSAWRCAEHSGKIYTFVGHMHDQMLYYQSSVGKLIRFAPHAGEPIPTGKHRRWVAVVGSLGQPRDGKPEACYAMFEPEVESMTFHRVPYDNYQAAQKVIRAGLPQDLANRLLTGN
jgi:diadenosine tetraphosphatase ApaH/serine/threonine PP2A family protein phosphatase